MKLRHKENFSPKEQLYRYGVAVAYAGLVIIAKNLLNSLRPISAHPFLLTLLPVVLTGLLAGFGPSLFALALSACLLGFYYLPSHANLHTISWEMLDFVLQGIVIIWIIELERRSRLKLYRLNEDLEKVVTKRTTQLEKKKQELAEMNQRLTDILEKAMDEPRERVKTKL